MARRSYGYTIKWVDELIDGNLAGQVQGMEVMLVRGHASQQTLIDEYIHVWNNAFVRGKHLPPGFDQLHRLHFEKVIEVGSSAKLGLTKNIQFHQMEMWNWIESGFGNSPYWPKFMEGVDLEDFKVFYGVFFR